MKNKLTVISKVNTDFEEQYLRVRTLENRVYSDEKVAQLPYLNPEDAHYKEWLLRAKTMKRFSAYLKDNQSNSRLMEIGCGNGWFSHICSQHVKHVCGVDVNLSELKQASRVFNHPKLSFYYWDIFSPSPFESGFDCIVLNACIQYFQHLNPLITHLKTLLNKGGEIHILDSPFYAAENVNDARRRSIEYYTKMGVPDMASYYYHHLKKDLVEFTALYQPSKNPLLKIIRGNDSPFGWYCLKK